MMESNRIEYKRELTDAFEKEAVAFLNSRDGGTVYIGITDSKHTVVGVSDCDEVQLKIKDRLKHNILPSCLGLFDVIHEKRDGKDVIRVTFAAGPEKPYHLKKAGMSEKGCFIRVGSASEPMPARMIEELFARRTRHSIGRIRSPRQDLTFEQLKIYYNEAGFEIGEKFAANLELIAEDGKFNLAAYLLADKNGNSVQVAKYAGIDRVELIETKEFGYCCLVKTCKQILEKLDLENRTTTQITSRKRVNTSLWNAVALREAVINAIVHNDFAHEAVPKFEIFADRLEITSAGSIPPGIEQDEFFKGYSIPRNKILMRIFKDLDLVEYLGSGMPRILRAYPPESFHFSAHFIRTTFSSRPEKSDVSPINSAESQAKTTGKKLQKRNERKKTTGKTGRRILSLCQEKPSITIPQLAQAVGLTEIGVFYQLQSLREKGLLRRIGGRKTGHWEVIVEGEIDSDFPGKTIRKKTIRKKLQERNYKKEAGENRLPERNSRKVEAEFKTIRKKLPERNYKKETIRKRTAGKTGKKSGKGSRDE